MDTGFQPSSEIQQKMNFFLSQADSSGEGGGKGAGGAFKTFWRFELIFFSLSLPPPPPPSPSFSLKVKWVCGWDFRGFFFYYIYINIFFFALYFLMMFVA